MLKSPRSRSEELVEAHSTQEDDWRRRRRLLFRDIDPSQAILPWNACISTSPTVSSISPSQDLRNSRRRRPFPSHPCHLLRRRRSRSTCTLLADVDKCNLASFTWTAVDTQSTLLFYTCVSFGESKSNTLSHTLCDFYRLTLSARGLYARPPCYMHELSSVNAISLLPLELQMTRGLNRRRRHRRRCVL